MQQVMPEPRLRLWVYGVGVLLVVGLGAAWWYSPLLFRLVPLPSLELSQTTEEPTLPAALDLPDSFKTKPATYGVSKPPVPVKAPEPIPMAMAVTPKPLPVVLAQPTPAPAPDPPKPAAVDPMPQFLDMLRQRDAMMLQHMERQPQPQHHSQGQPQQAPKEKHPKIKNTWGITPTSLNLREATAKEPGMGEKEKQTGDARGLIQHAKWAKPADPLKTLYRSQALVGDTMDAINSDTPGQVRVRLTIPVFDKFGYDREILPKDSIVVAELEGKPEFGQGRLNIKVVQIELPGAEVIQLKGQMGDEQGANGVTGKVNNHYGKLALATGINALLSLGLNSIGGTPSGFYANPTQQAGRDAAQSVSNDVRSITQAQLKVPPTITLAPGAHVTINLGENISFLRKPLIVR